MSDHIMMCNVPNAGACFVPSCACGCHKSTEPKVADPIIPSTGEVRADYVRDHTRNFDSYMVGRSLTSEQEFYGAKFDRWLAAHDAEVRAEAESDPAKDERLVRYIAMATPLGYQSALTVVQQMTLMIQAETEARRDGVVTEDTEPSDQVKQLLRNMNDPDDCWFDHHGGCQAHGYLSLQPGEKCPHAEAKELLASWVPVKREGTETDA